MTFHSKSWDQQQDELCEKINAALAQRKKQRMLLAAYKASQRWAKSREALSTMQFMTWHIQEPSLYRRAHTAQK